MAQTQRGGDEDDSLSLLLQRTYIFTFLLSSRLFMHPYELMAKVCHLCVEHQRLSEGDSDKVTQHLSFRGFVVIVVVLVFFFFFLDLLTLA